MAIKKITYSNKVALNENQDVADINKVNATDLNEIKDVVNTNSDNIGDLSSLSSGNDLVTAINTLEGITNYSSSEQLVGKWIDGSDLYRIVYQKTDNYSNTTVTIGTLNTNYKMRRASAMFYNTTANNEFTMPSYNSTLIHSDNNIQIVTTATWGNGTVEAVIYYTK